MKIQSKLKNYSANIVTNLLEKRRERFSGFNHNRLFFFVDENVYKLYRDPLDNFIGNDFLLKIEALETSKEYMNIAPYYKSLIENGFTRNDMLVTIGGGILQDISGFIASTLYRGIKWAFFPTTLLAQADSCIGSKTSINFGDSKNLVGTFYPPDMICIDTAFCDTLNDSYFNSGLGEIIKFHLMSNDEGYKVLKNYLSKPNLREKQLLETIIPSTLQIKKSYFDEDEYDTGRRNLLNYGHCFGHALESASNFTISHGEAVLVGMGFADLVSLKREIMIPDKFREFGKICRPYFPEFDLTTISAEEITRYMKRDKKRVGKNLTMILSRDIGDQMKCDDITAEEVRETFSEFVKSYPV